jgi:uncharacterized protein DUF4062/iSTAND domain-containing protein
MARIYVSSTFKDLEQERKMARDAILTLEHLPRCMENYTACEERPIENCLRDVRTCEGYVGVFAWRYGFVHPQESKSVTHLEYEEAGRRGIPRLIFILRDGAPWPPDRREDNPQIAKLRAELQLDRSCRFFSTPDELRAEVIAAVSSTFGTGRPIPKDLPYLCDRSQQEFDLDDALRGSPRDRPLFAVVHGDEYQCHEMFLERLTNITLPKLLELGEESKVTSYMFEWPTGCTSTEKLQKRLQVNLAEAACGRQRRSASVAEIQETLSRIPGPVALHTHLLSGDFQPLGTSVFDALVDFCHLWPGLSTDQRLLILPFIKYEIKSSLSPERRQPFVQLNADLRTFLESYSFPSQLPGAVLTTLSGVRRAEVETWAHEEVPPAFRDPDRLFPEIRRIFDCWEEEQASTEIPMESLARQLRELLYGYNSRREVA